MAGPPFEAGSILIALRASAENLQKEISKANATLQKFGSGVQELGKTTEQTSAKVVQGFTAMDRKTAQITARLAGFSQRLIGLQFVLQSFSSAAAGSGDGLDKFRDKTQGVVGALSVFAGIVSIFPNQIGLIVAAIAALAVLIADLVRQFNEASEAVKAVEKAAAEIDQLRTERLKRQADEVIRLTQLRLAGISEVDSAEKQLESNASEQQKLAEELVKIESSRLAAVKARGALEASIAEDIRKNPVTVVSAGEFDAVSIARDLKEELASNKEIDRLTIESTKFGAELGKIREELVRVAKAGQELRDKARLDEAFTAAIKTFNQFGDTAARIKVQLEQGIINPAEAVAGRLSVARAELEAFIALGVNAQSRISVLVDTKKGESAFDALTRKVLELQAESKKIEIKITNEAELKRIIESFQQLRKETANLGRDLSFGLVEPAQAAQTKLGNARTELERFLNATAEQQLKIAVEVVGVDTASAALFQLINQLNDAEDAAKEIKIGEDQNRTVQDFEKFLLGIPETLRPITAQLEAGFITPLEAAQQRAKALENLITQVALAAVKVEGPGLDAALEQAKIVIDQLFAKLEEEKKVVINAELHAEFEKGFAQPFSQSIGDAVKKGILEGQGAMEVLAGVGENLFSKFLDNSISFFEKGMTDALTAIAGAGGGILGGLFSGLVGLAGFFLSGRGEGKSTQTFAGVEGGTKSTEAVRGIVAGPESVSIAAVGDNLRRALVGVEARLDALIRISTQIRDGQGVGGTAEGTPFAGTVPTS